MLGWEDIDTERLAQEIEMHPQTLHAKLTGRSDAGIEFMEEVARRLKMEVVVVLMRILDARAGVSRKKAARLVIEDQPKNLEGRKRKRLKDVAKAFRNDPYARTEVGDY